MSEYQYYEFLAIDRPLDDRQQAEVRSLSTRALITATGLVDEFDLGDFPGDPNALVERYYDAHLYLANWGTRRVMLRLPRTLLDIDDIEDYLVDDHVGAWTTDDHLVLDLTSEDESDDQDDQPEETLSAIAGVRTELAVGDLRPLYLAWLAGYGAWERDEDAFDREADDEWEPPVPAGLATLTASQRALANFLRLDGDLLAVAARTSPPLPEITDDPGALAGWATNLPVSEKDRLLARVILGEAEIVRLEMLGRFRDEHIATVPAAPRRTVADLLDAVARLRAGRVSQPAG
ncbi:MAG TPA: hypothetical protein VF444_09685 [Pseudonocardiaceae bacterium]